ncbi:RNA-binding protein 25-like [Anopheles marshallii]|uniref:RNA-binding protein 25-like n=1 Tax=Anopheles marshallii TaxID=1521116 RepID=UPI00237A543E|nr:RNA-binding protein 25-like [Anopheles marshallii]
MEEPDRDRPANADAVGSKVNDPLTASFSSEDPDSWTLLGKGNDQLHSEPSGVQEIDKENVTAEKGAGQPTSKQRHDSHHSTDSQLDESSDGISVISECDTASSDKMLTEEESPIDHGCTVHFSRNINLKLPDYIPLTPPYTPDEPKPTRQETTDENKSELQIKRPEEQSIESVNSIVEHSHPPVSNASWVLFSLLATGMVAVLLGNSMRLQSRVEEVNFEHEKRISELELENNILKNEMNKLRHLYTRSELDEQVQRAEFEWRDVLNQAAFDETVDQKQDAELVTEEPVQTPIRKVPPQDGGVKRKVVWSGDEEEPMLIVDKDYVLPAFCYKQDQAVHDDLFAEYSAKYCDIKKRKIEAKQKKSEFHQKKQAKPENYNKFIHPKASEPSQEKRIDPSKPASPFNIDYQKAFDAIKAEGSVIVEALGSILDLSPDPEETLKANDEARTPTDTPVSHETEEQLSKCFEESGCEKVSGKQRYEDHKQRKYRENEYYRKEDKPTRQEEKEFIKQKDRASHEDGHKQRSDSREDVRQYDSKERKKEYHSKDKYKQKEPEKGYNKQKDNNIRSAQEDGHKQRSDSREEIRQYDNKERKKEYHEKDKYEQKTYAENYKNEYNSRNREDHHDGKRKHHKQHDNYRKNDHDDDDDDHHKKKFKQREEFKERDHKEKSYHSGHRDEQRRGSGERPTKQAYESGEGSYLEEFKRTEWTNGDRRHDDYEKHHKKHDRNQRRENDYWDEKRYKGRDEYRQNGGKHSERGSGDQHWQERMKHGRQAARDEQRQQMERDNNWYLERGTQREEDRMFPVPDSPTR